MNRPDRSDVWRCRRGALPLGYTLIEILVATSLTLLLMGAVLTMFGRVGEGISDSRAMLEAADRLRIAAERLQLDLGGVTADLTTPWARPENNRGYFEYIEGPNTTLAVNSDTGVTDTTVGDVDDILMFTTRTASKPFVGRLGAGTIQSDVAEVAWFLRGRTLYRRVLLVAPSALPNNISATGFYANYDISVRNQGGMAVANTLGDLTKRENRYAHNTSTFPFDARGWGALGLPTLCECSGGWVVGTPPGGGAPPGQIDFWTNDTSKRPSNPALNAGGNRIADDVILTNVIGFDVKAFDPSVGYVDLGTGNGQFSAGNAKAVGSGVSLPGVYDTWPTHYEYVGAPGLVGTPGQAVNGLDDDGNGVVDDARELITSPPYPVPLRGIQVKIRCFESDSRQVREVTVVQDFLPR